MELFNIIMDRGENGDGMVYEEEVRFSSFQF
jgi:hypothetical protein